MKKIITLLLALIIMTSCTSPIGSIDEIPKLSFLCPNGSAALSLLGIIDKTDDYTFDIVDGPELLQASFAAKDKDIIIAPINVGVKLAQKTGNYKLLGLTTWGNLFCYSKVENPKKVLAFGESAIPGVVTKLLKNYINPDCEFIWLNSAQEVVQTFMSGDYEACVVAEPTATIIRQKFNDSLKEIDFQKCYSLENGFSNPYPMSALFVNIDTAEKYLPYVESVYDIMMSTANTYSLTKAIVRDRLLEVDIKDLGFSDPELITEAYVNTKVEPEYAKNYLQEIKKILNYCNVELDENILIK